MNTGEASLEQRLDAMRAAAKRYEVALSVLAQGDASPYMTDDFKAKLAEAERQIEKYTIKARSLQRDEV